METSQIDVFTHLSSGNCNVQQPLQRGVDHEMRQFCKLFYFLTSQVWIRCNGCPPGALQFMMPIDGDKIWQPSLASRRLLEEHLCFCDQKCKEGRKGSKHPCQLLQRVHILICSMLQKCTTFPKTTHNSLGWLLCCKSSFV